MRNGEAGNPSELYRLQPSGLSDHAYRTAMGVFTEGLDTITVFPFITASAHTNFLSAPAMANCLSFPFRAVNPFPIFSKKKYDFIVFDLHIFISRS